MKSNFMDAGSAPPSLSAMTVETEKNGTEMSPGRFLRVLLSRVKFYSPRVAALVLTLLVEGVFNVLPALGLKLILTTQSRRSTRRF